MSESEQERKNRATPEQTPKVKKPYVKPEVRYERVFETLALSCGKVQVTQGSCHYNRKAS